MLIILYFKQRFPKNPASNIGNLLKIGINKNIRPPIRLNIKWATAMLTASWVLNKEASSAVIVVPIFAPIINGYTLLNFALPVATKGTTIDVA